MSVIKKKNIVLAIIAILILVLTYTNYWVYKFEDGNKNASYNRRAKLSIEATKKYLDESKDYNLLGLYYNHDQYIPIADKIYENGGTKVWVVKPTAFGKEISLKNDESRQFGPYLSYDMAGIEKAKPFVYVIVKKDMNGNQDIWAVLSDEANIVWDENSNSLKGEHIKFWR